MEVCSHNISGLNVKMALQYKTVKKNQLVICFSICGIIMAHKQLTELL